MARKVDWEKIKTEYVTGDISQARLAEKWGVSAYSLKKNAVKGNWVKDRDKFRTMTVQKAVRKASNRRANEIAKELKTAAKISAVLSRALQDPKQFNRYVVTEGCGDGRTETIEYVFDKTDMKALRDAAYALQTVVKIERDIRSMDMVLDAEKREQLELARKKLELDERRANVVDEEDDNTGVVIVAPVLEGETDDEE